MATAQPYDNFPENDEQLEAELAADRDRLRGVYEEVLKDLNERKVDTGLLDFNVADITPSLELLPDGSPSPDSYRGVAQYTVMESLTRTIFFAREVRAVTATQPPDSPEKIRAEEEIFQEVAFTDLTVGSERKWLESYGIEFPEAGAFLEVLSLRVPEVVQPAPDRADALLGEVMRQVVHGRDIRYLEDPLIQT